MENESKSIFLNRNEELTPCWGNAASLASVSGAELRAEAADNTPPAAAAVAAEEPGGGGQPWGRKRGPCWSCDRSTYPRPLRPEVRNELQRLGSCIERSHRCRGKKEKERKKKKSGAVNIETNQ